MTIFEWFGTVQGITVKIFISFVTMVVCVVVIGRMLANKRPLPEKIIPASGFVFAFALSIGILSLVFVITSLIRLIFVLF